MGINGTITLFKAGSLFGETDMRCGFKFHLSGKRILYTVCFFVFCLIDQRVKTTSGLDGWGETFRELLGAVTAALILSHYRLEDLRKRKTPYLIWSLFCLAGGVFFVMKGQSLVWFLNDRIVLALDVFLFGLILIHTFIELVCEKHRPRLNKPFACVWLVMMALMSVSGSGRLWPFAYLVMFGCFYLTDYTDQEEADLLQGMLDGIILAFFILQGWCFVFRPYDMVRYVGVYNNSNMNALFYLEVLAAVCAKLVYVYRRECSRWIRIYYWLGVGALLGFLFMTISRTGWMTAAVLLMSLFLFLWTGRDGGNVFRSLAKRGLTVLLCLVLTFPLAFGAVRYLPPLFHHPVWFFGEWREQKVHSWDKWDSEKFVNVDRLMRNAVGRVSAVLDPVLEKIVPGAAKEPQTEENTLRLEVEGENQALDVTPLQRERYEAMLEAGFAMDPADRRNSLLMRKTIYRYYAHLLNFRGHPDSELAFQMLPDHQIGHAHNIYLQFGVEFGIPVLALFAALVVWSAVSYVRKWRADHGAETAACLLFLLVPAVFGCLEYCWGAGSLAITMLFVVWRRMICDGKEKRGKS
ncbi:MAG: hypothetical protein NC399_10290 [Muribaculum sp.]|nr:hypothetical protein [Muribaculum sp.]